MNRGSHHVVSLLLLNENLIPRSYSVVLKVCDELDKAGPLHDYYKRRLSQHIDTTILPALRDKDDENLLKTYIKEWKDYTLLTHFMRKMFNYLVSEL
jgi:cullin 1